VIPSPEEGAPPEVCELVLTPLKFELIVGSDGRGEGFSGPGNVTFDSPSAVDPWCRLPVRQMLAATWGRYNFVLPYGRVIKRYTVERTAEPVAPPPVLAGV
jgi:acetoacetate decarboxylase